jgi:hypothetical protein
MNSRNGASQLLADHLARTTGIAVRLETVRTSRHAHDDVCKRPTCTLKCKAEEQPASLSLLLGRRGRALLHGLRREETALRAPPGSHRAVSHSIGATGIEPAAVCTACSQVPDALSSPGPLPPIIRRRSHPMMGIG